MSRAPERMPARVFISHTGAAVDDARQLAAILDDLGYESHIDLTPGSLITKSVMEALGKPAFVYPCARLTGGGPLT